MDIQAEKLSLIKWLTEVEEPNVIEQFIALKNTVPSGALKSDWWNEIGDDEKAEIEEGLAQADRNELIPHEEVMAKYQKYE
ncbi:MAG TPA: hypothetical protein VGN20_04780 [Mucilaginibacter sp.]|jgi:hypothetical protein